MWECWQEVIIQAWSQFKPEHEQWFLVSGSSSILGEGILMGYPVAIIKPRHPLKQMINLKPEMHVL